MSQLGGAVGDRTLQRELSMITRASRSLPDRPVIPPTGATSATAPLPPAAPPSPVPDAGGPPAPHAGTALARPGPRPDPVGALLREAAAHRPLEDVSRLVAVLSAPPHDVEHADHVIRAAVESRSVEEVARLMTLLYRPPLDPHCGDEAVRAAATHRPVEEVVELVERLARERAVTAAPPALAPHDGGPAPEHPAGPELRPAAPPLAAPPAVPPPDPAPARAAPGSDAVVPWTAWAAAPALILCGVAHVLVRGGGLPPAVLAVALASSALCVLSALLLVRRPTLGLLTAAVPVPAALAGAQLLAPRVGVAHLSRATEATLAPPWLAAPAAAAAVLTLFVALFVGLARLLGDRRPAPGTPPEQTPVPSHSTPPSG